MNTPEVMGAKNGLNLREFPSEIIGRVLCCRSRENSEPRDGRTVFGWCHYVGANTKIDRDGRNSTAVIFVLLRVWELSLRSAVDGFPCCTRTVLRATFKSRLNTRSPWPLCKLSCHMFFDSVFFVFLPYRMRINSRYPRLLVLGRSGDARAEKIKIRAFRWATEKERFGPRKYTSPKRHFFPRQFIIRKERNLNAVTDVQKTQQNFICSSSLFIRLRIVV